jgi:hypothetical protein
LLESHRPFAQKEFEVEIRSERDAVQKLVASKSGGCFLLPITEDDLDLRPGQPMRLEEGFEIGLPVGSPELDVDSAPEGSANSVSKRA